MKLTYRRGRPPRQRRMPEYPPRPTTRVTDLSPRDLSILRSVARFKQLSSHHIQQLHFTNSASKTSATRSLVRLVNSQHLARIERRMFGGAKGGSGQYVYQLGRRGYYMFFDGRYVPARAVGFHSLGIADCYVTLNRLAREGVLSIEAINTEPDCWETVGGVQLKPDLYVEVLQGEDKLLLWLEVDMATEQNGQIKGKLEAYWRAYNLGVLEPFPVTLWVTVDEEREKQLRWLISQGSADAQALFRVTTFEKMPTLFQR